VHWLGGSVSPCLGFPYPALVRQQHRFFLREPTSKNPGYFVFSLRCSVAA
jgi:hypothetical protein